MAAFPPEIEGSDLLGELPFSAAFVIYPVSSDS